MATVRYIVNDVAAAVAFYTRHLGFTEGENYGAPFASVHRSDLELWLAGPQSSAGRAIPDGRVPQPGGWLRLVIEVDDIAALVEKLKAGGIVFRNDIVTGPGGQQILIEDPSGNPIELFQPA